MKKFNVRQNVFPVLASMIWGPSFIAMQTCMKHLGPFTFLSLRSLVAFLCVLAVTLIFRSSRKRREGHVDPPNWHDILLGGFFCGLAMTVAAFFQQVGLAATTVGKAGFITAMYIIIVPILGIFLKRRAPKAIWVSLPLAAVGLYCLCMTDGFSISRGDFFVMIGSFCWAIHIYVIDHFSRNVYGEELSTCQFFFCSLFAGILALTVEDPTMENIMMTWVPLVYTGAIASGLGYTLQILAQKGSNPSVVTILLSLESVFAVLAGAIILGDRMTPREYLGCALMFTAVILIQLPSRKSKSKQAAAE